MCTICPSNRRRVLADFPCETQPAPDIPPLPAFISPLKGALLGPVPIFVRALDFSGADASVI